jgi:pyridoxal phosphate enzyme (YggS family)
MSRREELLERLTTVQEEIAPFDSTLIVVTKTYPVSDVSILHDFGCANFGENRSSEGAEKSQEVQAQWHFQGSIQSNKLREISQWADFLHSLDSSAHAQKLSNHLGEKEKSIGVFLQLSLDGDPTRGGVTEEEIMTLAAQVMVLPHLHLLGLMSVPPVEADLSSAYNQISQAHQRFIKEFPDARYLSAGMSNDYMVALNHGATHIRVGSKILGSRTHTH